MNNIAALAESTGLKLDKKNLLCYGNYQGYTVSMHVQRNPFKCRMNIGAGCMDDIQKDQLSKFLSGLTVQEPKVTFAVYEKNHITVEVSHRNFTGKIKELLEKNLKSVVDYCIANHIDPCCQECGMKTSTDVCHIDNNFSALCPVCFEKLKAGLSEAQREIRDKKTNIAGGVVGSLIGSLIGVLIWILAYQFGYIVAIAGLVMVVGSLQGFKKLGGKLNLPGCIFALALAAVMLLFAEYLSLGIEIFQAYGAVYDISMTDALLSVPAFLEEPEIYTPVLKDVAIGYLFMIFGSIPTIRSIYRSANLQVTTERME